MEMIVPGFLLHLLCVTLVVSDTTTEFWPGKDCPVDPDIGLDDPNNVFSCKPDEECCTKNLKPACCAAMPTDMMVEDQITLWVPLAGRNIIIWVIIIIISVNIVIITVLGLFVWFCRSDQSLLDGETPCLQKFCCCLGFKKRGDDGHLHLNSDEFGSNASLKSSKSTALTLEDETDAVAVEDDAANLEAVLDPQEDEAQEENNEGETEEAADGEAADVEEEATPEGEDGGEGGDEGEPTEEASEEVGEAPEDGGDGGDDGGE